MLRKNVVRALLGVAVPSKNQRHGLAEAENGLDVAGFQEPALSILPDWIEGTRARRGSPKTADLICGGAAGESGSQIELVLAP